MDDNKERFVIPKPIGQACGIFAGAYLGWQAGEVIGHTITPHLPTVMQDHAELLTHSLGIAGAFGCVLASYMLSSKDPDKALLVAATAIVTYGSQQPYGHYDPSVRTDLTDRAIGFNEASADATVSPTEFQEHSYADHTERLSIEPEDGGEADDCILDGLV